ncbi:hypothetical protein HZC32_00790 [Candidatus Woesearchaeota archaeon]|nr:hypothetical protein [Candidatus Woesearchaeota archaeon]
MFDFRNKFSWKFYTGIVLVVLSLIIGGVTKILLLLYFDDLFWRWLNLTLYVLSWPLLIWGAWWVGKEYLEKVKKYADYKFYHESLKRGTAHVYSLTKEKTQKLRDHAQGKTHQLRDNVRKKLKRLETVNSRLFRKSR